MQTQAEQILWKNLRHRRLRGLKFRRQHPIGPYIVDFYCTQHRLIVELDGGMHEMQKEQDRQRSSQLAAYGYRILRIKNHEVESDLESVLARIAEACGNSALLPEIPGEGQAGVRQDKD